MPHENRREATCKDTMWRKKCLQKKNAGKCNNTSVKEKCQKTCGFCGKYYDIQPVSFGLRIYSLQFFTVLKLKSICDSFSRRSRSNPPNKEWPSSWGETCQ